MRGKSNRKRTLAAGALGLGLVGSTVGAKRRNLQQDQASQVLVFAYDYQPGMSFSVVSQFQQSIVDSVLGAQQDGDGQQDGIVSDSADYNGYLAGYQTAGDARGEYILVFVRNGVLQSNQQYQFTGDASFFDTQANLLQANITTGGGGDGTGQTTTETPTDGGTAQETTADETTQQTTTTSTPTTTTTSTPTNETGGGGGGGGGGNGG